ncbi:hypothetical protein GOV06_02725 [Candidatus Woesearchaeota archaeon]|nr:hypothetical protein [Candidatus Woesearchaeota archaeon]
MLMEIITPAMEAWDSLRLNSDSWGLEESDLENLKSHVANELKGLGKDYYEEFCQIVHYHSIRNASLSEKTLSIPNWGKELSELPNLRDMLKENIEDTPTLPGYSAIASCITFAVAGYIGGAIGAGTLADYLTESQNIAYVAAPAGSVLGAIVGGIIPAVLHIPIVKHYKKIQEQQEQETENLFNSKVEEFIQKYSS